MKETHEISTETFYDMKTSMAIMGSRETWNLYLYKIKDRMEEIESPRKVLLEHPIYKKFNEFMVKPVSLSFFLEDGKVKKKAVVAKTIVLDDNFVPKVNDILYYAFKLEDQNYLRYASQ